LISNALRNRWLLGLFFFRIHHKEGDKMGRCRYLSRLIRTVLLIALSAFTAVAADDGFLQVTGPCRLSFPADHGPTRITAPNGGITRET
jgi:hypothetical protein